MSGIGWKNGEDGGLRICIIGKQRDRKWGKGRGKHLEDESR